MVNVFACEKDGYNLEFTNLVFTGVSSIAGTSCGLKVGGNGNLKVINCNFLQILVLNTLCNAVIHNRCCRYY